MPVYSRTQLTEYFESIRSAGKDLGLRVEESSEKWWAAAAVLKEHGIPGFSWFYWILSGDHGAPEPGAAILVQTNRITSPEWLQKLAEWWCSQPGKILIQQRTIRTKIADLAVVGLDVVDFLADPASDIATPLRVDVALQRLCDDKADAEERRRLAGVVDRFRDAAEFDCAGNPHWLTGAHFLWALIDGKIKLEDLKNVASTNRTTAPAVLPILPPIGSRQGREVPGI